MADNKTVLFPPQFDTPPTTPVDSDPAANIVTEGAAVNTLVGITAFSTDSDSPSVTYSLIGDTSNGGFKIDPVTGVVTVADPSKIDFETAAGHAYTVTTQASDGFLMPARTFTIFVHDVAPTTPVDGNNAFNAVSEGAANGTAVGITAVSTDVNGPGVTWSLIGDTSNGGFAIDATTGVITVADPTKIDYESSAGHAYTVTAQSSDGFLKPAQTFTIYVQDVAPSTPVDGNNTFNAVSEGVANGTAVGITAVSTEVNGPGVTWSLIGDSSNGAFAIDATTGVITVADSSKIDYESSAGHAYTVTAQASDGFLKPAQTFTIYVQDVAPSTPVDSNYAFDAVSEGAANGTAVGITAVSTDVNGPGVTWSLIGDSSNGGFAIDATTGVITVADSSKIDYESSAGHAYTVTAQASDGYLKPAQNFTIYVQDVGPTTPVDGDGAANTVLEGAANGTAVGITAVSTDVNGGVTWSLIGDTSNGGFAIDATTGVITVADSTKIDYETAGGHAYTVTAQASDGFLKPAQTFTIGVQDVALTSPADANTAVNSVAEGAAIGSIVGLTAFAADPNGPATAYSLTVDSSLGGFTIDSATGVVTVADPSKINFEGPGGSHSYDITVQATNGVATTSHAFTIGVTDIAPSTPTDTDGATDAVSEGAANGTAVGITASSTDINGISGGTVKYTLTDDATGKFAIDLNSGVVTVANGAAIDYETATGHAYSITVQASDGTLTSSQTFSIGVLNVNEAPVNGVPGPQSVNEDTHLVFTGANAITISDVDASGGNETVTLSVANGALTLSGTAGLAFTVGDGTSDSTMTFSGTVGAINTALNGLSYLGNLNTNGPDTLNITTNDNGNTGSGLAQSDADSVAINVGAVNDTPSFTVGADQTVAEDAGAQTVPGFATAISPGSADEAGQTVDFITSNDNNALFLVQPGIDASGNLTYTPAADANGSATVTVQIHDNGGGADTSVAQTFVINVGAVNDTPSFTVGADQTVAEDAGAQTVPGFVTAISPGPADEAGQTVDFITSNDNNALFLVQPGIDASGNLTYTPAADANGSATVTVQIHDNGGGADTSVAQTFVINVGAVNDTPSFTVGADQTVAEDAGAQTVPGFATAISPGSADEAGQTVDFITSNDNNALFLVQPGIDASGNLTYTPAADANGSATVTVQIHDNGGGADTSVAQTFVINVGAVNDTPSFTVGADQTVAEDAGAQTVPGFATAISPGPADEAGQIVDFITSNDNNALFLVQPGIDASGNLTYTPAADANGSATVTVQIHDNGGGADTSVAQTFVINVGAVNDTPSFTVGADQTVAEDAGAQTVPGFATAISPGPANEAGQTVDFITSNDNNALFLVQPGIDASGNLTYTPTADANGSATVTVQIHDNGGGADTSVAQTFVINVGAVNDAPTLTATSSNPNYTPGADLFSAVSASVGPADESSQLLDQVVLTVTNISGTANDFLTIDGTEVDLTDGNSLTTTGLLGVTATVAVSGTTATVTLSSTPGLSGTDMAALVDGLSYTETTTHPGDLARVVTITSLHDTGGTAPGVDTSNPGISSTVSFDIAPTITGGATLNYVENQAATAIDNTIVVNDTDDTDLESATVKITSGFVSTEDVLSATTAGTNVAASFSGDTLTLTGHDTLAHYQQVLRSVTYQNTSQDPSGTDRVATYTVNDGDLNSTSITSTIHVAPVNDEPTLTATALNPGFIENGSPVDLFSTVAASTIEAGQNLDQLILTVTNVAGTGATESLSIDGTTVALTNLNSQTTATNGMTASVALAAGTATVTIFKSGGISSTAMQTLVDNLAYGNTSDDPGASSRAVTLTSLRDTGPNGGVNNDDNIHTALGIQSTVAVTPVNDEPTLTATANGGGTVTFTESASAGGSNPVDLFSTPISASAVEAGQLLHNLVVTVSNVTDTTEFLIAGTGTAVELQNHSETVNLTGGGTATATVLMSGTTATVTFDNAAGLTATQVNDLVDSLKYDNTDDTPTAGVNAHTVTITSLSDDGLNVVPNDNIASLSVPVNVTVVATNDAPVAQDFNFTGNIANDAIGNTSLVLDDTLVAGAPDPAGPQKTINGSLLTGATDVDGPNALTTVAVTDQATTHGHVTINTSGEFSYTPNAGYIGNDTFTYTISDGNTPTAGTDTGSVTINVATPKVWYVNADAASDGDGTSANPFNTLTHFQNSGAGNNVDGAGDTIFLYNATNHYTGASTLTLENNEKLIGENQGLTVNGTPLVTAAATNGAIIDGGVVLNSGATSNTISGVTLGNAGAAGALSGTGFGTLNIDHTVVNTTNNGMILTNGAFGAGAAFTSFTSAGATDVSLTNVTGSVDLGTGSMNGLFAVSGGSVNTTYSGNLSQANNAAMVNVSGGHTGTMTFQTGTLNATNGTGLQFDNADGSYNFNGTNTLNNLVGGATANAGIDILNGSNGNFSFSSNSSITGQNSTVETAFNVAGGGAGNITYAGTIGTISAGTDNHGTSASIVGHTGGTVALSGSILDSNDSGGGIGISGNANTTINFSGTAKTLDTGIGDGVSMDSNTGTSNVNFTGGGLTIATTNGSGFIATGAGTYTVTGSGNTINTVTGNGNGTALNLGNVTVGANGILFASASASGSVTGMSINTVSQAAGSSGIDINGGTIVNASSRGVDINATSADISIASGISTTSAGRSVEVTGTTGNKTIAFSGAIDDNGQGVNLTTNTGTTMNFTGGLQIDASGTNNGFVATGGGTVNVTGTNHVATGTGTAVNISNTTIGASGATFHDISANGGTNGIVLVNTGGGAFVVTGDGTNTAQGGNNTGGTIQNLTGADGTTQLNGASNGIGIGIYLSNASNVTIQRMNIHDASNFGVDVEGSSNFVMQYSKVGGSNGNNTGQEESSVRLLELAGTNTLDNNDISGGFTDNIRLDNHTAALTDLDITNNKIHDNNATTGNQGILVDFVTGAAQSLHITGNTFLHNRAESVFIGASGGAPSSTAVINATVTNNTFTGNRSTDLGGGFEIQTANFNGHLLYDISGNTLQPVISGSNFAVNQGSAIQVSAAGSASSLVEGRINNNKIGTTGVAFSGTQQGSGITVDNTGSGTTTTLITNNDVQHFGNTGIAMTVGGAGLTTGTFNATITGNTVHNTDATSAGSGTPNGINGNFGTNSGNAETVNLDISNNTLAGSGTNTAIGEEDFRIRQRQATDVNVKGYGGSQTDDAAVVTYIQGLNPGNETGSASHTIGIGNVASVPQPNLPPPLRAAAGGVQASSPTPGETHLSQAQLDSVVAAAIAQWSHAGASAAQLAALAAITFTVTDLSGDIIGEQTPGHITIDTNAAGHGWFVDPTPNDNSEFTHAQNAEGTDLLTDPSNAAAGHLDLLTAVSHEMGHVLGLDDEAAASSSHDLMFIDLVDGERRLPDATDVTLADGTKAIDAAEAALPVSAQAAAGTPMIVGASGNDTIDAGHGGSILFGGAGADNFVFGPATPLDAPTPAQITHVADYSAAQGDTFDFSALTSSFHNSSVSDALVVRAVEDASGKFAMLQVDHIDPMGMPSAPNWVNVAQLDGAHAGDSVNVLIDNNHSVHLAQIHVDLLV